MSFLSLILKNPFRSKNRAILAIIGIMIGIATIVALGGITDGLIASAEDTLHSGGSDITVFGPQTTSAQASSFGTGKLNESWVDKISEVEGVNKVVGIYSTMVFGSDGTMVSIVGIDSKDISFAKLTVTEGRLFDANSTDEIVVGKLAKEKVDCKIGDEITYGDKTFKVVGFFESGNSNQDMSIFTTLTNVQDLAQDKGNLTSLFIKVDNGQDADTVADRINSTYGENVTTISSLSDMGMVKDLIDMLNAVSLTISLLAIVIGAVGIINTMLMSVMERTREIGVLKAVGWSNKRIIFMIVCESIVLTVVAGIVGSIIGVLAVELLCMTNLLSMVDPIFNIMTFVKAFAIAIFVGILGGIYPAYNAVKLPPTEALMYE